VQQIPEVGDNYLVNAYQETFTSQAACPLSTVFFLASKCKNIVKTVFRAWPMDC
jgi:hypothetical protein